MHGRTKKENSWPTGVLIDPEDESRARTFSWSISHGYVVRSHRLGEPHCDHVLLHRFIMNAPSDLEVDHINGNKLDNRKSNLRLASIGQNTWNTLRRRGRYLRGVKKGRGKKYQAVIRDGGKEKTIGWFSTEQEAHEAYCKECERLHGEFSWTRR